MNATITFYDIRDCGYFKRGDNDPLFGSFPDFVDDLIRWVQPGIKPLLDTCTYTPSDDQHLRTFCMGMTKNDRTGDFLFVAWNEVSNIEGQVAHIDVTQAVGNPAVEVTDLGADKVPGYPSYFWFIPSDGLVANIRFEGNRLSGTQAMWGYARAFLTFHSRFVVTGQRTEDAEINILGYRDSENNDLLDLSVRFQAVQRRKPQHIESIRRRRLTIRKIIRKAVVFPRQASDRSIWRSLFVGLGMVDAPEPVESIRAKYELPYTPSDSQLDEMISSWENDHEEKWDDLGFQFQGEQKVEWLSAGEGRFEENLQIDGNDPLAYSALAVLRAVSAQRAALLRLPRG